MYPFLDTPKDRRILVAETVQIIQDVAAATLITVSLYLGGMHVMGIIDLTK